MTELDPYAVLGVPRNALRPEIARAYRTLARQHHPDAGAPPSPTMARINEAWHVLRDPIRRTQWDRQQAMPVQPATWAQAPGVPLRRPEPAPPAPPSSMDSPLAALAVVGAIGVLVAVTMIGVSVASAPPAEPTVFFTSPDLELRHPETWSRASGDEAQADAHRIILHLVTYPLPTEALCTVYGEPCQPSPADIPTGEASVVVIGFEGGTPPEPEPLVQRPFGLDADDMIGGRPAAIEQRSAPAGRTLVWWQLSPPGFPDRWIEVHAMIADTNLDESAVLGQVQEMLETVEFRGAAS